MNHAESLARATGSVAATVRTERRDPDTGELVTVSVQTWSRVSAIGACLCTSFSYDVNTGACKACRHESHASRIHCGVMVNG